MSQRLYYLSDETLCQAVVVDSYEQDGRYVAVLDRTLFHPQGGGQLADCGWIDDYRVLAVESCGEQILHITERLLSVGAVQLQVDAEVRTRHSRLHSAGHLIGVVGMGFGLHPCKAQHWPGASRVVFQAGTIAVPEAWEWEDGVARLLQQNGERVCRIQDEVRLVGFGALPAFPCGGTHVRSLSDLGRVCILSVRTKKEQVTVEYDVLSYHHS